MDGKYVKIVVYVPESHADQIREVLAHEGCGKIVNYEACSFSMKGIGRFRALEGANPTIGKIGQVEEVVEERIETICGRDNFERVLSEIKKAHPYEEPAIDVYPLL